MTANLFTILYKIEAGNYTLFSQEMVEKIRKKSLKRHFLFL
jgi:hypothetical protein